MNLFFPKDPALSADLKQFRLSLGLTQKEAADNIGVTAKTWRRWEQGKTKISLATYRIIRQWCKNSLNQELAGLSGGTTTLPHKPLTRQEQQHTPNPPHDLLNLQEKARLSDDAMASWLGVPVETYKQIKTGSLILNKTNQARIKEALKKWF
jgi:transcriptional regulator with XRE-family HTH domain